MSALRLQPGLSSRMIILDKGADVQWLAPRLPLFKALCVPSLMAAKKFEFKDEISELAGADPGLELVEGGLRGCVKAQDGS